MKTPTRLPRYNSDLDAVPFATETESRAIRYAEVFAARVKDNGYKPIPLPVNVGWLLAGSTPTWSELLAVGTTIRAAVRIRSRR